MGDERGRAGGTVDVVIVTYNSARTVPDAIAAVRSSADVRSVVVVDNASKDATRQVLSGARVVLVEMERNVGFAAGVNAGVARCVAPYILLLNPDAVLKPADLDRLVRVLEADTSLAAAGPLLVGEDGRVNLGGRRFSTWSNRLLAMTPLLRRWRYGTAGPEYPEASVTSPVPVTVDYLWGAAALVRRDFLAGRGGLDERFFLYSEDEDLGRAARGMGLPMVVVPEARATHIGGASTADDDGLALARLGHALLIGLRKWTSGREATAFEAGFLAVLALRLARDTLRGDRTAAAADRRAVRIFTSLRRGAHPSGPFPW